jgi:signal transduction histidine kinase
MDMRLRKWRRSLGGRLLVTYLAGLLVSVIVISSAVLVKLTFATDSMSEHALEGQARWLERGLRFDASGQPVGVTGEADRLQWVFDALPYDLKYRVLDAEGRVLLSSEADAQPLAAVGQPFDGRRRRLDVDLGNGRSLQVLTMPVERAGRVFYVQAARSERAAPVIDEKMRDASLKLLKSGVFSTVVVSLAVLAAALWFTLRRVLQPLRQASAAAADIGPRSIGKRVETQKLPTELVPMVDAFNQALDRLEHGYRVQQDFLASAAHELKTPLALIRAQVELEESDKIDRQALLRDIDFMARQVQQLLQLAEVSEPRNYVFEPVDVQSVAGEVTGYLGRLAERRSVRLELDLAAPAGPLQLQADRSALFILLKNLIENALQHTPAGAAVRVKADTDELSVQDEGSGIADEHLPKLFTRFWRGPQRRDEGAGLGLAICQEIAAAHGWVLSARNRDERGAVFSLRFGESARAG